MKSPISKLQAIWFDGETYIATLDRDRLKSQLERVFALMKDSQWRTLHDIQVRCGGSEAGISARLRDLRKERFGNHRLISRRRTAGTWEYRLIVSWAEPHQERLIP